MSLSVNGTGTTTNDSSQGYHSISTSSTVTNIDTIRTPLTFTNPLYYKQENVNSDLSEEDDDDSSKALYFLNNLCIESCKDPTLVHSSSRQSLQQPLIVGNNCSINSNIDSSVKIDGESTRRQQILSSQQFPPKMGIKALNHTPINKVNHIKVSLLFSNVSFFPPRILIVHQ
jgi:hypothetical protein